MFSQPFGSILDVSSDFWWVSKSESGVILRQIGMSGQSERKWTTLRKIANPEEEEEEFDSESATGEGPVSGDIPTPPEEEVESLDGDETLQVRQKIVVVSGEQPESEVETAKEAEMSALAQVDASDEEDVIVERTWFAPSSSLSEEGGNGEPSVIVVPLDDEGEESLSEPAVAAPVYVSVPSGFSERQEVEAEAVLEDRVLVAHTVPSTSRLIRETLENFTVAQVDTTSDPIRAFELALQKNYRLFYLPIQLGELGGAMLYELICKAYTCGRGPKTLAPAVVFIREKEDPQLPIELARDARVKDTISKPIQIDRLLRTVTGIFEVKDPTERP